MGRPWQQQAPITTAFPLPIALPSSNGRPRTCSVAWRASKSPRTARSASPRSTSAAAAMAASAASISACGAPAARSRVTASSCDARLFSSTASSARRSPLARSAYCRATRSAVSSAWRACKTASIAAPAAPGSVARLG